MLRGGNRRWMRRRRSKLSNDRHCWMVRCCGVDGRACKLWLSGPLVFMSFCFFIGISVFYFPIFRLPLISSNGPPTTPPPPSFNSPITLRHNLDIQLQFLLPQRFLHRGAFQITIRSASASKLLCGVHRFYLFRLPLNPPSAHHKDDEQNQPSSRALIQRLQ